MIKIDLEKIFSAINGMSYVLLKQPNDLNDYKIGSDLDIFTNDLESVSSKILHILNSYIESPEIIVNITDMPGRRHIDVMERNKINIRFDLCTSMPFYEKINIKESYFDVVIENRKIDFSLFKNKDTGVNVTNNQDEFIIRYIEYHEWFESRPDKIKHIDVIKNKYSENEVNENILRLHRYLAFPLKSKSKKTKKQKILELAQHNLNVLQLVFHHINKFGFKKTVKKILGKLK